MAEQVFTYTVRRVTATLRSARLRATGATVVVSSSTTSTTSSSSTGSNHTHDNLADLNRIAITSDDYITLATSEVDDDGVITLVYNKAKAGYADDAAHADSADEATHATSADEATHATDADHANKADESTHATSAHQLDDDSPTYDKVLRKDQDDSSEKNYTFSGLLTLAEFLSQGGTTGDLGSGFAAFLTDSHAGRIETDELLVRNKAIFNQLEIRKLSYAGGNIVLSPAGSVIEKVTYIDADDNEYEANEKGNYVDADGNEVEPTLFRCYWKADDGTTATTNTWAEDDQARCQTFNRATLDGVTSNRFYWRRVVAIGDGYVDLSLTDRAANSDYPQAGDSIVQMGNRTNASRQGFIYLQSEGDGSPAICEYVGVNSYDLTGCLLTRISPTQGNVFTGTFQVKSGGEIIKQPVYRGDWVEGTDYNYNDQVTYNGDLWLCVVPEGTTTTEEPTNSSQAWKRQTDRTSDATWYIAANAGSEYLTASETRTVTASLYYGSENMDEQVVAWSIKRTSSDTAADEAWNAEEEHASITGGAPLSYQFKQSDLQDSDGNVLDNATFTIYATASQIPTNVTILIDENGAYYTDNDGVLYTL